MLELIILAAAVYLLRRQLLALNSSQSGTAGAAIAPRRVSPQLTRLTTYADRLFSEKKWLAAEKAYLGVLKLDHKNPTAYSHLGIIYSAQRNLADAIECFQIAVRLRPGAITYQNLGIAYFENHNYMKSIAALEKAIMFEPNAHRYVSLASAYKKIHDTSHVVTALERAAELEPTAKHLSLLAEAYTAAGRADEAAAARDRMRGLRTANLVP